MIGSPPAKKRRTLANGTAASAAAAAGWCGGAAGERGGWSDGRPLPTAAGLSATAAKARFALQRVWVSLLTDMSAGTEEAAAVATAQAAAVDAVAAAAAETEAEAVAQRKREKAKMRRGFGRRGENLNRSPRRASRFYESSAGVAP